MGLLETVKDERQRQELTRVPAAGLVHGVVSMVEQDYRWMRPLRFVEEQMRALGSVQAWHPGLYRQMARTSAGICVEFDTDAREVALEVRLDAEPRGTREVLAVVDRAQGTLPRPHDGVSADVDGRHLPCVMPADGVELVSFSLVSGDPEEALGLIALPGLARTRRVRIWLPCLRGCVIRDVYCDGTFIRPVAHRKVLLALGDSITQGFVADDPAFAWPSLLAQRLGLDVVNQGVGGQVFQPGSLLGLAGVVDVARIVVAFGDHLPALELENDMLSTGSVYASRYVIWNNFGGQFEAPDLEAYRLNANLLKQLGFSGGVVTKLHQSADPGDTGEEYLAKLELLEYDMLYGDRQAFEGEFPYRRTDMRMGSRNIAITDAVREYHRLLVTGENFTEFSKIIADDQALDTVFIDSEHIVARVEDNVTIDAFCVAQVDRDGVELSRTEEYGNF